MPVNREALPLGAGPRSVADARRWVVGICRDLSREDLVEAAELGVSELVTNALLHGSPPISVRVRGTWEYPRIEVYDGSFEPPVVSVPLPDEDDILSTFGRGLDIVAMCSAAWGATLESNGKAVWFVPSAKPNTEDPPEGDLFDYASGADPQAPAPESEICRVRILQLPVRSYLDFRNHYRELWRELRLISLAHESQYPIAKSLSDLFTRFEAEVPSLVGTDLLKDALSIGAGTADLEIAVPQRSRATVGQMLELLELADAFCRAERLLTLAFSPEQQRFQRWYLGEFVRQCQGHDPQPWEPPGGAVPGHHAS